MSNRKKQQVHGDRELTPDTEHLICLWVSEGDSIDDIAKILNRTAEQVQSVLDDAVKSGRYDLHIRQRQIFLEDDLHCKKRAVKTSRILQPSIKAYARCSNEL